MITPEQVKNLRLKHELTILEVCEGIGISAATYNQIERGMKVRLVYENAIRYFYW